MGKILDTLKSIKDSIKSFFSRKNDEKTKGNLEEKIPLVKEKVNNLVYVNDYDFSTKKGTEKALKDANKIINEVREIAEKDIERTKRTGEDLRTSYVQMEINSLVEKLTSFKQDIQPPPTKKKPKSNENLETRRIIDNSLFAMPSNDNKKAKREKPRKKPRKGLQKSTTSKISL